MVYLKQFVPPSHPDFDVTTFCVRFVEAKAHWNKASCEQFGVLLSIVMSPVLRVYSFVSRGDEQWAR